jgi:hypothetical protein
LPGSFAVAFLVAAVLLLAPRPAQALPVFAHRYGLTCQACHTVVPHLTPFGQSFLANGYRIRGLKPKPAFPLAVRLQTGYSSAGSAEGEAALPKTVVDEVEVLLGGAAGSRGSYFAELYAVDGGVPGRARDVWYAYRATADGARTPVTLRGGQFTLPLPLDPETFRETPDHYAVWDQAVGGNPFTFFEPKLGAQVAAGDPARQIGATLSLLQGHDAGSGLPAHGLDTMVTLRRDLGDFSLQAYRYDGTRAPAGPAFSADRFRRQGYGLSWARRGTELDAVYQTGNDTASDDGEALRSSGGFLQARQALNERTFALARWDATHDSAFARALTAGFGYRFSRNTRLTVFDTPQRDESGRRVHVISSSFLVAL